MPRRTRETYVSSYSSFDRQENRRRIPSPIPYLLVILLVAGGLAYYQFFAFRTLTGTVRNSYTGEPLPSALITLRSRAATPQAPEVSPDAIMTTTTGADGSFVFERVPEDPLLTIEAEGFGREEVDGRAKRDVAVSLVPSILSGLITSSDGQSLSASIITSGARTTSGPDGKYVLDAVPADHKLIVKSPGYLASTVEFGQVMTQNVSLEPMVVKAIYISADTVASPGKLQALIDMVDRTELNAVVIDVKGDNSGFVLYDSRSDLVREIGTVNQIIPDLDALLKNLKTRKIYAIARLPVFWDQAVTAARPEWALKSKKAPGQVWVDGFSRRWANPYNEDVWNYNIEIAREVVSRGFDEVQFDNAHFPSEGELEDIDYGPEGAGKKRVDGIKGFLERAYNELSPLGVYIGINVFAFTPYVQDDQGIGHNLEELALNVDYICPTIYPADFPDGFMDFAKPAERPGEVVGETTKRAVARASVSPARIRPWLQDFSRKVEYDAPKVRAELDAAEQNGAVGWMLWNFGNVYTEGALKTP